MKGAVSAQKALQVSETKTRELLEEQRENYFPNEGSLICPPGKSMIFTYLALLISDCLIPPSFVTDNNLALLWDILLHLSIGHHAKGVTLLDHAR